MTAAELISKPWSDSEAGYPLLLRMGHVFETALGHRAAVGGFGGPLDVAIGGDDDDRYYVLNKYVSDNNTHRVRFAPVTMTDQQGADIVPIIDGEQQRPGHEFLKSPVCCTSNGEGTIFMTDEHVNVVAMFSTTGETIGWWGEHGDLPGQLNAPSGISLAPDGTLWVVSTRSPRVQTFTHQGAYIGGFGTFGVEPGQLNYPWAVDVDPINMSIVVADWRNDRIQRFSPEGKLLQIIDTIGRGLGPLNRPSGVAVDTHGDIYVCDRGSDRVLQFNQRGMFIESLIGDAPMTVRGADRLETNPDMLRWRDHIVDLDREKRFWRPTSVRVDDQFRVLVVDTGRWRMQVYRKTFRELAPGQADAAATYTSPQLN